MGKPLIQQRRGKGSQRYRTPKHTFTAAIQYPRANDQKGTIIDIATCPAHTSPLILVKYDNGECAVNAAPEGIYLGQEVHIGASAPIQPGNVLHLKDIPEGTLIFNIESKPKDASVFLEAKASISMSTLAFSFLYLINFEKYTFSKSFDIVFLKFSFFKSNLNLSMSLL